MVEFTLANYVCTLPYVECKNGSLANPVSGKRMYYYEEDDILVCNESKYVCQNLKKPVYAATYEADRNSVGICIWSADKINKKGLNWSQVCYYYFFSHSVLTNPPLSKDNALLECIKYLNSEHFRENAFVPIETVENNEQFTGFPQYFLLKAVLKEKMNAQTVFHLILNNTYEKTLANVYKIHDLKFGIEVEFTGMSRLKACKVLVRHLHAPGKHIGGAYDAYTVTDAKGRTWKISRDASIDARTSDNTRAPSEYKCELIIPVLAYEEIESLQKLIRLLRVNGMRVNSSCGIHVHVDASGHTAASLKRLSNLTYLYESTLYYALGVTASRKHWCRQCDADYIQRLNKMHVRSIDDIRTQWYLDYTQEQSAHYHSSRYHALNLHSLFQANKGIEFRMFNATTHAGKIKTYIQLSLALCTYALNTMDSTEKPDKIRPAEALDKQAFSEFLTRLSLCGSEFKTARFHLMKVYKEAGGTYRSAVA